MTSTGLKHGWTSPPDPITEAPVEKTESFDTAQLALSISIAASIQQRCPGVEDMGDV